MSYFLDRLQFFRRNPEPFADGHGFTLQQGGIGAAVVVGDPAAQLAAAAIGAEQVQREGHAGGRAAAGGIEYVGGQAAHGGPRRDGMTRL